MERKSLKTSTTSSNWQSRRLLIVRFRNRGPGGALMACSSNRNRIAASQVADAGSCSAQVIYHERKEGRNHHVCQPDIWQTGIKPDTRKD